MENEIFRIYKSICHLDNKKTQNDLISIINKLCEMDFSCVNLNNELAQSIIKILMKNVEENEKENVSKICFIIKSLFNKTDITIVKPDEELIWLFKALKECPSLTNDIITAIKLILLNCNLTVSIKLSESVLDYLNLPTYEIQIRQILSKYLAVNNNIESHLSILMVLHTPCELIYQSLRTLREILEQQLDTLKLVDNDIRKILTICWRYMSFNNENRDGMSVELHPTPFSLPQSSQKSTLLSKKRLSFHKSFEDLMENMQLPDSGDDAWENSRTVQSCIRQAAICLLITVIKFTESNLLFQYWPYLIFPGSPSLRQRIRNDSSWCVRLAALVAIEELILSAKFFLTFAEKPRTAITSFTTFSEILGSTLLKLHEDLLLLLNNSSIQIVKQMLRCLTTLVTCTPYQRVSDSLPKQILDSLIPITMHTDTTVVVETCRVISAVLKTNIPIKLCNSEIDLVFKMIYMFVINDTQSVAVIIECLQLLSVLAKNYMDLTKERLDKCEIILKAALEHNSFDLRLQAGRTIEVFSISFQECLKSENSVKILNVKECFDFWSILISEVLKLLQDEHHSQLRTVGCDCLGSIDAQIFEKFNRSTQILSITLLFACTKETECSVRGAAIRALGRGILEAGRAEDAGLIADIAQACLILIKDDVISVRTKTAWVMSNLTDALIFNRENNELCNEDVSDNLYGDLLVASIKANSDTDKVKCNIIRAIGNLVRLITYDHLNKNKFKQYVIEAIQCLVKNTTNGRDMKIKWNSCYALGNILKNNNIYSFLKEWDFMVYPALLKLVVDCNNFKVRINASLALSSPSKREYYGSYWINLWNGLVQCLDISQNIDDFKEYKHRDTLIEQICFTLAHLTSVAQLEDIQLANENIYVYLDVFQFYLRRCHEQIVPEKASIFTVAVTNLNSLRQNCELPKQKQTLDSIIKLFTFSNLS